MYFFLFSILLSPIPIISFYISPFYIGSYGFCALYVRSTLLRHNSIVVCLGVVHFLYDTVLTLLSRPGRACADGMGRADIKVTTPVAEGGGAG